MRPWEDKTAKAGFLSSFTENEARSWVLTQIEQELRSSLIRDRGLTAQKLMPGTDGQVMVTDDENGVLYSEWGKVDPTVGIDVAPSCLIWRNATHPALIANGATAYVDYTDTLHSDGNITADPANDRITFNVAGKYLVGYNLLWRAAGLAVLITGSSVIEVNAGTASAADIAYSEHLGYNIGGFSNHANTLYEFAVGDFIKVRYSWGGVAGNHGIYSEASAVGHRVCGLYAAWHSPSS